MFFIIIIKKGRFDVNDLAPFSVF